MAYHCESPYPVLSNSKIAIIGAGVSGLAAAKQLYHHNPIVFEASDSIGGVWKSCAYNSTKLQSTRKNYEFAEFPWQNRDDPSLPSKLEVLDYLESYAKHFDVLRFVKFNSKVVELRFSGCSETTDLTGNAGLHEGAEGQPCTMVSSSMKDLTKPYSGPSFATSYLPWRGASKFMESFLLWKLPLNKYGLKPDHSFEEDIAACQMVTVPKTFFAEADKGNIVFKRASAWWFWEEGIEFGDNTKTKADVVILATACDDLFFRDTIHPLIPNMAFVGYVESFSNVRASELRSMWVARLIDENFKLPSTEIMVEQTLRDMEFMRKKTRFYKRPCVAAFNINHDDQICEEMG
ncbi:putative flavin-containing monooxygenase 1 [Hibiscus syriacus]|uniref:Flavin-containing monooxygenase n=1 Tax=Hibiscus syriacus TaxID=106335 RepID=A0A6A3B499_HIBSY|nr:putative flavin-containing monooxygenase 1 [Hibiscus syriacus]